MTLQKEKTFGQFYSCYKYANISNVWNWFYACTVLNVLVFIWMIRRQINNILMMWKCGHSSGKYRYWWTGFCTFFSCGLLMDCWEHDTPIPWQVECSELLIERPHETHPCMCSSEIEASFEQWAFANFLYLLKKSFFWEVAHLYMGLLRVLIFQSSLWWLGEY